MKTQEIRIVINVSQDKLFEFTIEPKNTSKWIDKAGIETVDTEQIGLGTKYVNNYGVLTVTDYDRGIFFELTNEGTQYQCSYSHRKIDEKITELTYFECMLDGSLLIEPVNINRFKKLKNLMEE